MNTKTLLSVLGIIAVAVIIFFVVKSKDSTMNTSPFPSENDSSSMTDDSTTQTVNDTPTDTSVDTMTDINANVQTPTPTAPENPAFPTTGFEPTN